MLRCFDCNTAADAQMLLDAESWSAPVASNLSHQPVVTEHRAILDTEYKRTFQNFACRSVVDGAAASEPVATDDAPPMAELSRARTWYTDLLQLRRKAITYKVRGWGKETVSTRLVYLYDRAEDANRPSERKIISALYLDSLEPRLTRDRCDRPTTEDTVNERGAKVKSSPSGSRRPTPPAVTSPSRTAAQVALKLHKNQRSPLPGSAQPVVNSSQVDGAKNKSPSNLRTLLSPVPGAPTPVRQDSGQPRRRLAGARATVVERGMARNTARVCRSDAREVVPRPPAAPAAGMVTPDGSLSEPATMDGAIIATLVKSAPLPTRVRSPEDSALLHSPEPVNWTLPLDTARAFAVKQNVAPGYPKTHSNWMKSQQSPSQGQISPLHKQLVNDSMARGAQPTVHAPVNGARSETRARPVTSTVPPGASSLTAPETMSAPSEVPGLVRPAQATDQWHYAATGAAEGHQNVFSAGSAGPPPAAFAELPGSGKSMQVSTANNDKAGYHVI